MTGKGITDMSGRLIGATTNFHVAVRLVVDTSEIFFVTFTS